MRVIKKTNGFTLIEMLVAIGIGMVTLAALTTTFVSQTKFYNAQEQMNEMEQNVRGVMDIMTREIKMAGYDPQGAGFTKITTFTISQLTLQADLDANGSISSSSSANEQITYAYDSANRQITRSVGSGTAQALADNIIDCSFAYLDGSGNTATTAGAIRQMTVSITGITSKPDPNYAANNGYRTYTLSATITPPNLGL